MYEKAEFYKPNLCKENSTVACGFDPIQIHYSDYPKRINEVCVFSKKYHYSNTLLKTPKLHL